MTELEKIIKGLETIKQFFGYGLPSTAEMFDSYYGTLNDAVALLKEQETVVRCKDCGYADGCENGIVTCGKEIGTFCCIEHPENWYCANGVRKE